MSIQTVANRWVENGITQLGIKPVLNNAFEELTTGGPGYCDKNINSFTTLPGQPASASQIILDKTPYGPTNCNQYATLIKPGVNPLTLRGQSDTGVNNPVNDSFICLESCDYIDVAGSPMHNICSDSCIRSTKFCVGDECLNDAPGGLADWMGRPKSNGNTGTWGSAVNNQIAGGTSGTNGYFNPVRLIVPDLMKNGFVTQGCECQSGTSRIAGGTFYDWAQVGVGTGPHTLNTDSGISSEVWNGVGTCNTWSNSNSVDIRNSTCNLDILKYAQTCAWCKNAVLTIPGVEPDQTYPPHKIIDNGVGIVTSPTYCTFGLDASNNYTVDNGDCLGFGVNGQVRIPCSHPTVTSLDCPIVTASKQKVGLFCNVPARYRLTGESCGFAQVQDIEFMSIAVGSSTNNYSVSYSNGAFSVFLFGYTFIARSGNTGSVTTAITGGRQIAITFPNGTTGTALLNYLKSQPILTNEIDVSVSLRVGANLSNQQSSIPPQISSLFNTALSNNNKTTSIQDLTYLYRYSSDYPGYTGSYLDGNILITYSNGPLAVSFSGSWTSTSPRQTNVVAITFPNGTTTSTLVNYINAQIQASSNVAIRNLVVSGSGGVQSSYYTTYYYGFAYGGDAKAGGIVDPGNCNVHLDGTKFTGTWSQGSVYNDPTTGTVEPWIGKQGIKCDYFPNQGSCQTMWYDPDATDDCQICDSEFWDWIPGGWQAVIDKSSNLHNLALTAYIPKFQNLQTSATCNQTSLGLGSSNHNVAYCGKDNRNNRCSVVCGQGCVKVSWDTTLANNATLVDNLVGTTGGINANIPSEQCPDLLCERNPVLTLRGTSEEENNTLVHNWMNGIFDLTTLHGQNTGIDNPFIPDTRAYGQPDELAKRTIKALRCCLGTGPGFKSSDGFKGGPKTQPNKDPFGGSEMWILSDCPPGVICPSSDTCKDLFKSVLDGTNEHVTMDLNDFGSPSYPTGFSLDTNATGGVSEDILLNPAYYAKAYCEMMSGGSTKTLTPAMGLDDDINTLCRKAMYNYCISPVNVDVINNSNYWNAPILASTPPDKNGTYSKTTYDLPLKIFTQGCNMWFKNELQQVMPSDYGTRDMLLGSACQKLQVDGWYNPVGPDQSPLLQAFVNKSGKITDKSGTVFDLSYIGSASATSGTGSIPGLLANTCNCFLLGSKCQGSSGSNCSYQYCGAGIGGQIKIDTGNPTEIISPLNTPVDLSPYTSKLGADGKAIGDSSWTKYQDVVAPGWTTGLKSTNFTCAEGNAGQGTTISANEAGGTSNCFSNCNYVNEYDVCWNASPTNRKYSGEMLGGNTRWNCDFSEHSGDTCDPSKETSYSCYGDCENGTTKKDGTKFPSCGTQTWFDSNLSLNPGEMKVKQNRSVGKSDIMDTPYWQNFYSDASEHVSSANIPNIGSIYNPSRSLLASDSVCGSVSSIKPYNTQFMAANQCIISQTVSVNNQGTISGAVGINQVGSCNASSIFQGHDQFNFLRYMGTTDCTGQDTVCWNNNNFCLSDGSGGSHSGENCMYCGNSNSAIIDAPNKPNTCCLDPSLGQDNVYKTANSTILNAVTLGDTPVVSYFCSSGTCPTGSSDLAILQSTCGTSFTCSNSTDQATCESCQYCKWQPIYTTGPDGTPIDSGTKHCSAVCPLAPQNGWIIGGSIDTQTPTVGPITDSSTRPTTAPIVSIVSANLSTTDIVLIVFGIIIALAILINVGFFIIKKKTKPQSFGKRAFGKIKRF
jgi:hypothetical protein